MARFARYGRRCWLFAALLLAGCSTLQLSYNQADLLLAWRADSYFDFESAQKRDFHQRLDRVLVWHRREQLPEYARFANNAVERARDGVSREDILWVIDGLKTHYRTIVDHGINDSAELLATLSPAQLRVLQKQWAKDNVRFVEENELDTSIDKRKRARLKRMLGQISDWTGSLSRAQEQQIEQLIEAIPLFEHLRHQDRLRRQAEFAELLKLRSQRQEFQPRLHHWLREWERGRSAEYERVAAEVQERRIDFFLALEKLLTPAQRERALKRLEGFGNDFKTLSDRAAATALTATIAAL